jgi:hypothetical protein
MGNQVRRPLERTWMRVVDGNVSRARGIPRGASAGTITSVSRDAAGRVVVPLVARRHRGGRRWTTRWWLYDVRADRARRLRHVPVENCIGSRWLVESCDDGCVTAVATWGRSRAWSKCLDGGVFLRRNGRTLRVADREAGRLTLRGGTLVGDMEARHDMHVLARLTAGGKRCGTKLDETSLEDDAVDRGGVWLVGKDVVSFDAGVFVGTELPRGCDPPGPTGAFEQPILPFDYAKLGSYTIDGTSVYYADAGGIHRTALAERFRIEPPDNDDFENAQPLGDAPIALTPIVGNATRQAGEPTELYGRTIWFALRPQITRPVWIMASPLQESALRVFTGTSIGALTPVGVAEPNDGPLRVDAVAGQTYRIQLACSLFCYQPTKLTLSATQDAN